VSERRRRADRYAQNEPFPSFSEDNKEEVKNDFIDFDGEYQTYPQQVDRQMDIQPEIFEVDDDFEDEYSKRPVRQSISSKAGYEYAIGRRKGPRRRSALLFSAILLTLYSVYSMKYFIGINTSSKNSMEEVLNALAIALVMPHVACVILATIFCWLSWFMKIAGFSLVAGILLSVGCSLMLIYSPFIAIQMVLCYVEYVKMKKERMYTWV